MTESKLNPFDAELLVMIGDIAKSQPEVEENPDRYEITVDTTEIQGNAIEALKQAVAGRLGKRLLVTHTLDAAVVFNVEYDPTEYPEQIRTRLVEPDATAGTRYCRTLLEVDAIQVRRDNLDDLLRFTGGGTMTIPRTPNGRAVYSFPDGNGIFIDAPETYYIVREPDGRLAILPEREFNREFEPKGVSVPKEVEAMAAFFADMFPGSEIQIQRVDLKKNPRDKRRAKNQQKNRKGGRNNER